MGQLHSDMSLQPLENTALSWGIIGKSAPILAEITIRKSQRPTLFASNGPLENGGGRVWGDEFLCHEATVDQISTGCFDFGIGRRGAPRAYDILCKCPSYCLSHPPVGPRLVPTAEPVVGFRVIHTPHEVRQGGEGMIEAPPTRCGAP